LVTGTKEQFEYFLKLRLHPAADPAIYTLAERIKEAIEGSTPTELKVGEWHTPYVSTDEQLDTETALKCSVARCARVSYLNHDRTNPNVEADKELFNMLVVRPYVMKSGVVLDIDDPIHASCTEHQATPMEFSSIKELGTLEWPSGFSHADRNGNFWSGNFKGWVQFRKTIE